MNIKEQLVTFGLTNNEAKVYLACLELGLASIQQIAHQAKLNRITVYGLVEELIKKGFVHTDYEKNKRKFAAYPPMKLYDVLSREHEQVEKKKESLKTLIPELKALNKFNDTKTNIIYYEGEEGLKNWASDALATKGELLEWTKIEEFTRPFSEYLKTYYYPKKFELQIPTRFIFIDTPEARAYVQNYIKNPKASPMKARFISQKLFDTSGFMVIFNNRFSIALPKEMRAVTIVDDIIANTQRKIWEFGWLHANDEIQNKPYPLDK
ncbi:MAG: helix-turn-helix domain-containing protein [Patescibacteria group bacterium]|jgi:sugar-specific transcriptional regulator TrmB